MKIKPREHAYADEATDIKKNFINAKVRALDRLHFYWLVKLYNDVLVKQLRSWTNGLRLN